MNLRIQTIRESEKLSHTKIYTDEELYRFRGSFIVLLNRNIAEGAAQFFVAGSNSYRALDPKITEDNCYAIMPAIVNISFSIELYLKAMLDDAVIKNAKKIKKAHCLDYLLSLVPDREQNAIVQLSIKQYAAFSGNNISEVEFWDEMRGISDSFMKWRYFYEYGGSINIAFLNSVASALNSLYTNVLKQLT